MAYSGYKRVPAARFKPPAMQHKFFAAPTGGWVSAINLATSPPNSAQVLENWLPTTTGMRMRKGSQKHATMGSEAVESLMTYIGASTRELFAASDGDISNITNPADPDTPEVPDVTGQTSNYYSYVNVATAGGNFLSVVNGTDAPLSYNGAAWSNPAWTGPVSIAALSHVGVYRSRQWFIEGGSLVVWYSAVNAITGALSDLTLSSIFERGGEVLFTATWSMDAGDGLDDKLVIVSTEGEYAVFQGDDPSDPNTWFLVGRYDAAPPIGKNGYMQVGGDLMILTEIGIIPMTAIQSKGPLALGLATVSKAIQPDWIREVQQRRAFPWEIAKWPLLGYAFVTVPVTGDPSVTPPICFVINLETGAWAKITGWNTRCMVVHDNRLFFGTNDGTVMEGELTGADDGELYYCNYVGQNEHFGMPGQVKTVRQARAVFRSKNEFNPLLSVSTDYEINLPPPPNAATVAGTSGEWDVGLWDVALWDTGSLFFTIQTMWVSIGRTGFAHAMQLQVTSGSEAAPTAELVTLEATYDVGGLVV